MHEAASALRRVRAVTPTRRPSAWRHVARAVRCFIAFDLTAGILGLCVSIVGLSDVDFLMLVRLNPGRLVPPAGVLVGVASFALLSAWVAAALATRALRIPWELWHQ